MSTPLMIGPNEREALDNLRKLANEHPVDMRTLTERLKTPDGKAAHKKQMTAQSVAIPADFLVTFSIEIGHPIGTCRHMSMSVGKQERVPSPQGAWMVAEQLGFVGGLESCVHWLEDLQGHGRAINVVQPVNFVWP